MPGKIRILLVEDSNFDARIIKDMLIRKSQNAFVKSEFTIERAESLYEANLKLQKGYYDLILLDLTLPDSMGLNTLDQIYKQYFEFPIVVLTSINDQNIAINAVKRGAQDYIVKGQFDENLLIRSIHYSIERHKMLVALRGMALVDQLTGLYNRHGFITLAQHHLKLAKRKKKPLLVLYCDMDYLKLINDNFGHKTGDKALIEISQILQDTFRESDIIARLGGDEFVILAINAGHEEKNLILDRLHKNIENFNIAMNRKYDLSLSVGAVVYNGISDETIDELLDVADKLMYENKKKKRNKI